jgi:hypothetical protein
LLLGLLAGGLCAADAPKVRDFNGPELAWELEEGSRTGRLLAHECVGGGPHDNSGVERIVVAGPAGESIRLVCLAPRAAVIEELSIRLWVKASRPDLQLAAQVSLPRSVASDGTSPARILVRGAKYERAGRWQELVLRGVPKSLEAEARILRSVPGAKIDAREAVVDSIVLIVPGEPQGVEIETDDLAVDCVVRQDAGAIQQASYPA